MKTTSEPAFESRWEKLVRQACADVGPPANVNALLEAVRAARLESRREWLAEFSSLASRRMISACFAGALAVTLLTSWQVWDLWQALPWAQLVEAATGGAL